MIKKLICLGMIGLPAFILMQQYPETLVLYLIGIVGAKFL